jgi:two-component system chemotaxis response regulator CheY
MTPPHDIRSPETSILVVDDCPDYALVLRRILQTGMGYRSVEIFSTIDAAYDAIAKTPERFPVLFVDYHFPNGRTGAELLERLRQKNLLQDKVAFFITAEPAIQKAIEANSNGAYGVVVKPFNSDQLEKLIERVDRTLKMELEQSEDSSPKI